MLRMRVPSPSFAVRSVTLALLGPLAMAGCVFAPIESRFEGESAGDCTDGADNDVDGAFDCDDDGCAGAPDCLDGTAGTNGAPGAATVGISPADPTDADDLACEVRTPAADPDGDPLSYRYAWTVDGVDSGLSGEAVSASSTSAGQAWTCSVTANDGALDGPPASAIVTIVHDNRAPSAPTVSVSPAEPGDHDDLLCEVTGEGVDPDGDAVSYTYAWTLNGADTGLDSATVSAGLTSPYQTWTCTVTPTDGSLSGEPGAASVSVVDDTCVAWDTSGTGSHVFTDDAAMPDKWLHATWEGWFRQDGEGSVPCSSGGTAVAVWLDARLNTGDHGGSGSADGVLVASSSSGLTVTISTGGSSAAHLTTTRPAFGVWHHLAVTYDSDAERAVLYVNGAEEDRVDVTGYFLVTNDRFGVGSTLPCESCGTCQSDPAYFNGAVDWVRVSETVRYTAPFTPSVRAGVDSDTVLLWSFDLDDTTQVLDLSGDSRHGDIYGGAMDEDCAR